MYRRRRMRDLTCAAFLQIIVWLPIIIIIVVGFFIVLSFLLPLLSRLSRRQIMYIRLKYDSILVFYFCLLDMYVSWLHSFFSVISLFSVFTFLACLIVGEVVHFTIHTYTHTRIFHIEKGKETERY